MPDIKEAITRPVGPLPAYAWVIVAVGGYFAYVFLSNRSSNSTTTAADTSGAPSTTSADLTVPLANLTQQIADLQNTITNGNGGTQSGGTSVTLVGGSAVRFMDLVTGKFTVLPTSTAYTIGAAISTSKGPAHLITQNGVTYAVLDRNFTAATTAVTTAASAATNAAASATSTVASTAVQAVGTTASLPTYGNNTATPRPVATVAETLGKVTAVPDRLGNVPASTPDVALRDATIRPAMPTFGSAKIPAYTQAIPATTPLTV